MTDAAQARCHIFRADHRMKRAKNGNVGTFQHFTWGFGCNNAQPCLNYTPVLGGLNPPPQKASCCSLLQLHVREDLADGMCPHLPTLQHVVPSVFAPGATGGMCLCFSDSRGGASVIGSQTMCLGCNLIWAV